MLILLTTFLIIKYFSYILVYNLSDLGDFFILFYTEFSCCLYPELGPQLKTTGLIIAFQGSHSIVVWGHCTFRYIARGWLGSAPSQESVFIFPHFKPQSIHGQLAFFFYLPLFTSRGSLTPPLASRSLAVIPCLAKGILAHYQELYLWQLLLLPDPKATRPSAPLTTLHFYSASGTQRYPFWFGAQLCPLFIIFSILFIIAVCLEQMV